MSRIAESMMPGPYNGRPGFKEPTTSRDAAKSIKSHAGTLRERVLDAIRQAGPIGLTPDEAAIAVGATPFAVRPRLTELKLMGRIVETGERRTNVSKMKAKAWRAA